MIAHTTPTWNENTYKFSIGLAFQAASRCCGLRFHVLLDRRARKAIACCHSINAASLRVFSNITSGNSSCCKEEEQR